ncbi:class I adenylate-forming enzyme family protein [Catenulispora subtropica]|uniref:Long-chain fatty acid--CoA ligase n=1 Tax=Catenulispora subtropica TaxID=450798 RepID=A0ABN2QXY1_9ACTN
MSRPADILPSTARRFGDRVALVTDDARFTYRELENLSARVAGALAERGAQPGTVVSIFSPNRWEWLVAYHGALRAGCVVNPINGMLTAEEVGYVLNDCGARFVFTTADKVEAVRDVATPIVFGEANVVDGALSFQDLLDHDAEAPVFVPAAVTELCVIAYTSGTTGHPKGAMQSHRAIHLNHAYTATMHVRVKEDVLVTALPMPHVYGNCAVHATWLAGGTAVVMDRFDAARALELIEQHRATIFEGVPAMFSMMLAHEGIASRDLSSITRCTVGGQTMPVAKIDEWEQRSGAPLLEVWGMTELAGFGTTHSLFAPNVHGSIGIAFPGTEIRVSDPDEPDRRLAPGEAGELMIRGPLVMLGYFGNEQATREAIDGDGWMRTGDVAYATDDGHYFVVDRRKDLIITGGYNVYPAEIERVVAAHPAVAMVAVGGVPDAVKGELARACVVLRPGHTVTGQEIIEYCRGHLAPYKLPRIVLFVDDLPKTSSGKIMRRELLKLWPAA